MVLALGVSAGASGARAILAHSDRVHRRPIDRCDLSAPLGGDVGNSVRAAIDTLTANARHRGDSVSATAVTYRTELHANAIRDALGTDTGTESVRLVREADAQLRYLRFAGLLPKTGLVILYDLGSSGLTLTLADSASGVAVRTRRSTLLGGDEVDRLLHRKLSLGGVESDVAVSRGYKEQLTTRRVVTAGGACPRDRITLTRNDLAELERAGVQHSASFIRQLIEETGTAPRALVLLGGGAHSPSAADWLERSLGIPSITDAQPELVAARGAVLLAAERRHVEAATASSTEAETGRRRKLLTTAPGRGRRPGR